VSEDDVFLVDRILDAIACADPEALADFVECPDPLIAMLAAWVADVREDERWPEFSTTPSSLMTARRST
jgi:hypothetical protein